MKILITNDSGNAHKFIREGWARAFNFAGHNCHIWNINDGQAAFDIFHRFEPDVLITQVYNLSNDIFKCIERRPHLKVLMKSPDYGPLSEKVKDEFPILYMTDEQLDNIKLLKKKTGKPDFLFVHYPDNRLDETHGYLRNNGFKVVSLLNAADILHFNNGTYDDRLACDLSMIGGFWGYKSQVLAPYILSLCSNYRYNIKLFGNSPWPCPQYCGFLNDNKVKDLFISTKINLNCHEPHSQKYGFDIVERPFKIMASGGFVISDYVSGLEDLFPSLPMAKTPEKYVELIDYFLSNQEDRKEISIINQKQTLKNHTYFNRCRTIFEELGLPTKEFDNIIERIKVNE